MKILVALKQVPDTESRIKVAADGKSLDPADVKWITSPYDEYALEEAIRIKEGKGAEVVALSVGSDAAKDVLKNALALGADSAVLLKGDGQGDAYQVAQMIAAFVKDKGFDLILCGNKGLGGDNAAMGPMLAELLGIAQANVIVKLELGDGTFRAEREIEVGSEMVEGALPAVITTQKGLNEPRYASLKGIMAAKKKTIEELDAAPATAGAQVSALALPPERPAGRRMEGEPAAQALALIQALKDEAKVF
ncbi:MAG: electron transfer flavoprotein subunit beta/FixA family protein [Holophagaceae bacterium]|uniref:Electron transfer flavoprotein subunit beta n=1 Tax=Candidatus Geothrix skivensis TaxID=2954439 RepID=A0A9D7XH33_9BACT|nr:electron transfer flavoprotein subunit beta/FixA family protein [Candidatus Geothrix skivensis]